MKSCKKFQNHFSACVKFHVENEWEISRMSSDGLRFFLQDFIKPQYSLVVQKLRREFTHAQNFLFKIPLQGFSSWLSNRIHACA